MEQNQQKAMSEQLAITALETKQQPRADKIDSKFADMIQHTNSTIRDLRHKANLEKARGKPASHIADSNQVDPAVMGLADKVEALHKDGKRQDRKRVAPQAKSPFYLELVKEKKK